MLKSIFDAVMERRARRLVDQVGGWLPSAGPVLDLGSGTGHLSDRLERQLGLEMVNLDLGSGGGSLLFLDAVLHRLASLDDGMDASFDRPQGRASRGFVMASRIALRVIS